MGEVTNLKTFLLTSIFLVEIVCTAAARTIYVDADGSADFSNIQAAINDAIHGDIIEVKPGTYTGPGNRDIDFLGKAITVRSNDPNDPNVVAATIIDCNGSETEYHRGFFFHMGEADGSVLDGLTITKGYHYSGGGIYISEGSNPVIINCRIIANSAVTHGGGFYCDESSPLISDCTIKDNWAGDRTGGIYSCNGSIKRCIISGNSALKYGGGLGACKASISNCLISGNWVRWRYGGALWACFGPITNCTIVGNFSLGGRGVLDHCTRIIINCIIWDNRPVDSVLYDSSSPRYSCTQDGSGETGSFSTDPCFVLPGYWDTNGTIDDANDDFWVDGDYHLKSSSPCVDAGNYAWMSVPCSDLDGGIRLVGSQIDMGCYETDSSPDFDGDWIEDAREPAYAMDPDRDDDGIPDGMEILRGSNPNVYDPLGQLNIPADINTIQDALFVARSGEVIMLSEGTYCENIYNCGRNIVLTGTNPNEPNVVARTILSGDTDANSQTANGCVIAFSSKENASCQIRGLTITGGHAESGGGINGFGTSATIINCNINGNIARGTGGGLYWCNGYISNCLISDNVAGTTGGGVASCHGQIINCLIKNNAANHGGGISSCAGSISYCSVTENRAIRLGGGIDCVSFQAPTITNCTISGNEAGSDGAGICCWYSSPIVSNCTVVGNRAKNCGGAITTFAQSWPTITNSIIWENNAALGSQIALIYDTTLTMAYSDVQGDRASAYVEPDCTLEWGVGNFDTDPCFMDPGYWDSNGTPVDANDDIWFEGDYHLLSNSPCIDSGDPNFVPGFNEVDIDGHARVVGNRVDMGADEFYYVGDFDLRGSVNLLDFAILASAWLTVPGDAEWNSACDISIPPDDLINVFDASVFMENWLKDLYIPQLPGQASNPNPPDIATDVNSTAVLIWTAGSYATWHDVYFGTSSSPQFASNQTATTFDPGTMAFGTTYYWRIDEINKWGTTTGQVWSFTTRSLPGQASNPNPVDYATDIVLDANLTWTAGSDATSHDVYFGTSSPGAFQGNQSETTFDPGTLGSGKTYYWRIDEVNPCGTTTGTTWSFTTMSLEATNPNPVNGATNVSRTADLSWTADPGASSHDVYFGTSNPPPSIQNQTGTTYNP
ncbi:MAG: choice-of-anchor Q domain-containing protein, partial [Planctomycetota bacterium]